MKLSDLELRELIPIFMREDETVGALSTVVNEYTRRVSRELPLLHKWEQIDNMDNRQLDVLAWELNVLWYSPDAPVETKRRLIKKSDMVYARLGTKWAVEEVISAYLGRASVQEFWEYDGRPHYFRIVVDNYDFSNLDVKKFLAVLELVKRKSQWLEAVRNRLHRWSKLRAAGCPVIGVKLLTHPYIAPDLQSRGNTYISSYGAIGIKLKSWE